MSWRRCSSRTQTTRMTTSWSSSARPAASREPGRCGFSFGAHGARHLSLGRASSLWFSHLRFFLFSRPPLSLSIC